MHYIFVVFFVAILFPSFSAIPKVPDYNVFLWFALTVYFALRPNRFLKQNAKYILLLLFFHLMYSSQYNEENPRTFLYFIFPFLAVSTLWSYYALASIDRKRFIIMLFIVGLSVTAVTTTAALFYFPNAARLLAGSLAKEGNLELNNFYLLLGIGSYNFSFMWFLSILMFVFFIRTKTHLLSNGKFLMLIFLMLYAIFKISITAPLLLLFLGLVFLMMLKRFRSKKRFSVFVITVSLLIYQFGYLLSFPLYYAADLLKSSENVSARILNLAKRVDGSISSNVSGDIQGALENNEDIYVGGYEVRALESWDAFLGNPLFGLGEVGGHNFYLDILGSFGLVGFLLVSSIIIHMYRKARVQILDTEAKSFYDLVFLLFIILGIIKTYSLVVMFVFMFFIVPLFLQFKSLRLTRK